MIRLVVHGVPEPMGSKSAFVQNGRAVMREGSSSKKNAAVREWQRAVADAARAHLAGHPRSPLSEPVSVSLTFLFPPVKSDPYRTMHATKPDLDKLTRSTLDALTQAGLLADDALVCDVRARKRYCPEGVAAGCTVEVHPLGEAEARRREARKLAAAAARKAARAAS